MSTILTGSQKQQLTRVFERGAEDASLALTRWLGRPVRVSIGAVEEAELEEASAVLGPPEAVVASCSMDLTGPLGGRLILVFEDRAGLALADMLLGQPAGSSTSWGELEQSAAAETANIVGCAYLNSLAAHLPLGDDAGREGPLVPSPPSFRVEFAASLLEFALMDQAIETDRVLLVRSRFEAAGTDLEWCLLFVPSGEALRALADDLVFPEPSR